MPALDIVVGAGDLVEEAPGLLRPHDAAEPVLIHISEEPVLSIGDREAPELLKLPLHSVDRNQWDTEQPRNQLSDPLVPLVLRCRAKVLDL